MRGHTDTVTGIELSPDGSYLLSTAMDNTGKIGNQHKHNIFIKIIFEVKNFVNEVVALPIVSEVICNVKYTM